MKNNEKELRKRLTQDPTNYEVLQKLSLCLYNQGKYNRAINFLEKALLTTPNKKEILYNLCAICNNIKNYEKIIAICANNENLLQDIKILEILGFAFYHTNQLQKATKYYNQIITLDKQYYKAYAYLADIELLDKNYDNALALYNKSLAIDKNYPAAIKSIGMIHLLQANFKEGWEGYEWRAGSPENLLLLPNIKRLDHNNSNLKDKIICVYAEQGFGDTIQFARFLPLLKASCKKLIFICQDKLISLFTYETSIDVLCTKTSFGLSKHNIDYQIPLLSLPYFFKTDINNIPPLLPCSYEKSIDFKIDKTSMTVGICWAGNPLNFNCKTRSMKFDDILPLIKDNPHIVFYNLQVDYDKEEIANKIKDLKNWIDLTDKLSDFAQTATIIEELDYVVSVDTVIAHLAGSLGVKTLLMLPYVSEWRWLEERTDSPWYSTITIFRQNKSKEWDYAVNNLNKYLNQ